jgi:hypothetical protein
MAHGSLCTAQTASTMKIIQIAAVAVAWAYAETA